MFDKEGKIALELIEDLRKNLAKAGVLYFSGTSKEPFDRVIESGITKKRLETIEKRQDSIESKLEALIELMGVKEQPAAETEHKLVKGKKSVVVNKAYVRSAIEDDFLRRSLAVRQNDTTNMKISSITDLMKSNPFHMGPGDDLRGCPGPGCRTLAGSIR